LVAVELREHDVEQDQVRNLGAPESEPLGAVRGDHDVVALLLERVLEEALNVRVVVDDEDLGRHQSPSCPPPAEALSVTGAPIIGTAFRASAKAVRTKRPTRASYSGPATS
jgi:hypothetical protein